MNKLLLIIAITFLGSNALAYSIHGDSNSGFVLMCVDGTSNTSAVPPNHNTAAEFCKDHGGVAAGYPKKVNAPARTNVQKPGNDQQKARDYNSSRSNKSSGK